MKRNPGKKGGIIDPSQNPFALRSWINQGYAFTPHRRKQVEALLQKTVGEIRSLDLNSGSYPAFVAIRWGYAKIEDKRLVPTDRWHEWNPHHPKK